MAEKETVIATCPTCQMEQVFPNRKMAVAAAHLWYRNYKKEVNKMFSRLMSKLRKEMKKEDE